MSFNSVEEFLEGQNGLPISKTLLRVFKKKYLCRRNASLVSLYRKGIIEDPSSMEGNRGDIARALHVEGVLPISKSGKVWLDYENLSMKKMELGRNMGILEEVKMLLRWEQDMRGIDDFWNAYNLGTSSKRAVNGENQVSPNGVGFIAKGSRPVSFSVVEALLGAEGPVKEISLWPYYLEVLEGMGAKHRIIGLPEWARGREKDRFVAKALLEGRLGRIHNIEGVTPINYLMENYWDKVVARINELIREHEALYLSGHSLFIRGDYTLEWVDPGTSGLYCIDFETMTPMQNNTVDGVNGEFIRTESLSHHGLVWRGCPISLTDNKKKNGVFVSIEQVRDLSSFGHGNSSIFLSGKIEIQPSVRPGLYEGEDSLEATIYRAMTLQQNGVLCWIGSSDLGADFCRLAGVAEGCNLSEVRKTIQASRDKLKKVLGRKGML